MTFEDLFREVLDERGADTNSIIEGVKLKLPGFMQQKVNLKPGVSIEDCKREICEIFNTLEQMSAPEIDQLKQDMNRRSSTMFSNN